MTQTFPLWTMHAPQVGSIRWWKHVVLCVLLAFTITVQGCNPVWVTTITDIVTAAVPALINILNIIAIAKGQTPNATLAAKIAADGTLIKTLTSDFATASTAAAPAACAQLQSAISVYMADQAEVMALANIADPATQAKVIALSALVAGTATAILGLIPNCQQAAAMRASLANRIVPLPLKSFVKSYNANLVASTGNAAVDAYTKSHKVHVHDLFVRVITLGGAA